MNPKLSAVIPVYNSEKILYGTYKSMKREFEKITKNYEILFRNDGSNDNSQFVLEKIAKKDKKVRIFSNTNHGLGFALRELFKDAKGDFVIYSDADSYLTFDLGMLPSLLKALDGADVVIASRYKSGKIPFYRKMPSLIYRLMNKTLFGIKIDDTGSGFVIFKKKVLDAVSFKSDGFSVHIELYTKINRKGFRIIEVPVSYAHYDGGSFDMLRHGPKTLIDTFRLWRKIK